MTVAVALLGLVVAVLVLLVAGLLRSHAAILRRLHELGAGVGEAGATAPAVAEGQTSPATPDLGLPKPPVVVEGRAAADIEGSGPHGEAHAIRVVGAATDTVVAFLSSGCKSCHVFWDELRTASLPDDTRLVVVTKGPEAESMAAVADLTPPGLTVVMSTAAWEAYEVPGSPYVVHVDGPSGRVRGEGTGPSWEQVRNMLTLGAADLDSRRSAKAASDAQREREADDILLAAGIQPGDERLYVNAEQATPETRP
jgi:hypothetical protein